MFPPYWIVAYDSSRRWLGPGEAVRRVSALIRRRRDHAFQRAYASRQVPATLIANATRLTAGRVRLASGGGVAQVKDARHVVMIDLVCHCPCLGRN